MGKTNSLNDNDLKEFVALQKSSAESDKSWTVAVKDVDAETWDLSVKNPNAEEEAPLREPSVIIEELRGFDKESESLLTNLQGLLQ